MNWVVTQSAIKLKFLLEIGSSEKKNAPALKAASSGGFLSRVKAVFSPPANVATSNAATGQSSTRIVQSGIYDNAYLALPDKLTPRQILNILRAGLYGDVYRTWALSQLMMGSWPILRKCSHELREPCSNTRFVVKPYSTGKGEAPSQQSLDKADLIRRAMANFSPNQANDERGWNGMVYDLCDAMLSGFSTIELMWHPTMDWGAGMEKLPRAAAWANPRWFTFDQNGEIKLGVNAPDAVTFQFPVVNRTTAVSLDPSNFLVAKFKSQSGSVLAEGFIRPLALYWAAMKFCYEPMLIAAQNFGAPYVDVAYSQGMNQAQVDALIEQIEKGLSNRVIAHVEGTTVTMDAGAHATSQNPQNDIVKLSDQYCMELLLGTEATTKQTAGKLGGSNADSPQDKTKSERVRGLANWVATECLSHFVDAVLYQNYGNTPTALVEKPSIEPDFTQPLTAQEKGATVAAFAQCNIPVTMDDAYDMFGLSVPEQGDKVINIATGEIGIMTSTEEDFNVAQKPPEPTPVPVKLDENNNPIPAKTPEQAHGVPPVAARLKLPVNRILAKATDADRLELVPMLEAAEKATHRNGDHDALTKKLLEIQNRK